MGRGRQSHFSGIKVLHDFPYVKADVCFVHGLLGNRETTWTADGEVATWPQTLLQPRLPQVRVLKYDYNTYGCIR
jgi:hypothetical protein